jgi:predicted nucleic acid-binding Zn finger protein
MIMNNKYIITAFHHGQFDVFNEESDRRYEVQIGNARLRYCSCPHWQFRLKKSRGKCKHIEMCEIKGGWNS